MYNTMLLRLDKHNRYHSLELVLQPHFYIIILTIIMTFNNDNNE